jgi:hypothetical protein
VTSAQLREFTEAARAKTREAIEALRDALDSSEDALGSNHGAPIAIRTALDAARVAEAKLVIVIKRIPHDQAT